MKITKNKIMKFMIEAALGFGLWSLFLTPYMVLVVKVSFDQYVSWLGMQCLLVPLIAPVVFKITISIENRLKMR